MSEAIRRPDLEMMPFKMPSYIGDALFPVIKVNEKAKNPIQYAQIQTDVTAQTSRALTSAPTANTYADAESSFSTREILDRQQTPRSQLALYGGVDKTQQKMARKGKRAVGLKVENEAIALTFGAITPVDILASFLQALDIAKETIEDKGADGKIALFGGQRIINRLKRYNEVVERMSFTGVLPGDVRDVRSISDAQLAAALGLDVILSAPTIPWLGAASVYDGYLGLTVLNDGVADPDEEVQGGRRYLYTGDGSEEGNPYMVETWFNDDNKCERADTTVWTDTVKFNEGVFYVMSGIDEENTVVTTAS